MRRKRKLCPHLPVATIGLDGETITAVGIGNIGSQVCVDYAGNQP